jgi:hypothetical protein
MGWKMIKRFLITLMGALALSLVGCGKNELIYPIAPQPYQPITQAPPPGYGYPGSGYPGYGTPGYPYGTPGYGTPGYGSPGYPYGGYPGGFQPSMPGGYPSAYTPFLPIDNFMRQNPQTAGYWPGFWNQWRQHCQYQGCNPYDFNKFWFDYCPQYWNHGAYLQLYVYLDQNFYFWMSPNTRFSQQLNPQNFWNYYQGYNYGNVWDLYY